MYTDLYNNQYTREALAFSSNRRFTVIALIRDICIGIGARVIPLEQVVDCFNKLHSAASILDDLADNETIRAGKPTFHIRHSSVIAAITSVHLLLDGIQDCLSFGLDHEQAFHHLLNIARAEEADIGMIGRDTSHTYLQWYINVTARKTSHEFLLLLDILSQGVARSRAKELEVLRDVINEYGLLLQLANDWRDWFVNDPLYRVGKDENFVLTNSLAIAMQCERGEIKLANEIGRSFHINEIRPMLAETIGEANKSACSALISGRIEYLQSMLASSNADYLQSLANIIDEQQLNQFWNDNNVNKYVK